MSPTPPDLTAVIVHFETPDLLVRCLEGLRTAREVALETIVIDNASAGFDGAMVAEHLPGARIMLNSHNAGFAVAANQGLRVASGRYLLLLNPDTIVRPDTLSRVVAHLDEEPTVGCATARLELEDGRLDLACRRLFPSPARALYRISLLSRLLPHSRRFAQYNLTYLPEDRVTEIDSPCGAFMMVRSEIRESVGLLDERYFMYGEDLDWAFRIKHAGWQVMYYPDAVATHLKRAASSRNRQVTIRAFHEAMRIFYGQHYQSRYPRLLSWLVYRGIDMREAIELAAARVSGKTPRGAVA